jgi:Na+/proline symporter
VRSWPWILVALATIIIYPELPENRLGYALAIRDFLPGGFRGLMVIAMFAAYMSTISSQLNWGASFVVNDLFIRFGSKNKRYTQRQLVQVGRVATFIIMLLSLIPTYLADTIQELWHFLISCGAGLGLVLILRWYWWRVNAWSEITATFIPLFLLPVSTHVLQFTFPNSLYFIVGTTSLCWIVVTYLTNPVEYETLQKFYEKVHPQGAWAGFQKNGRTLSFDGWLFVSWIASVIMIYAALFSIGYLVLHEWRSMVYWFLALFGSFFILRLSMQKSDKMT